jgi:hypothetical protein
VLVVVTILAKGRWTVISARCGSWGIRKRRTRPNIILSLEIQRQWNAPVIKRTTPARLGLFRCQCV